jgi:hypothetical protein
MSRIGAVCLTIMLGVTGCLPAVAADLPKEGNFTATFNGYGTYKAIAVGKTRYQSSYEIDGFVLGEGILDHLTYHCMGMNGRHDQTRHSVNFCVLTDKDGDQIAEDIDETYPNGAKEVHGTGMLVAGTGKYEGISGEVNFSSYQNAFRTAADNAFINYGKGEGHYKLSK